DAQKLSNQLLSQQMGSQLVGEVGGQIADKLNDMGVAGFDETNWKDNYGRTLLETAGNALVAAVTGGNAGAAAAGTAVADEAIAASSSAVALWAAQQTSDPAAQQALLGAVMNGIADAASAVGGAAVGGGSGATVLNASAMASAVEQNNFVFLIPLAIEAAEAAVIVAESGELAEGSAAVLSVVRSMLSAGKSVYAVSQILTSMGLNGDVLVHQAQSGNGSSTKAPSAGNGASASGGGTAAPEPEGEGPEKNESEERPANITQNAWDKERAAKLGYTQRIPTQKLPFNSHGQPAYWNGKNYITRDIDSHNVENGWKVFDRKGNREGTFDSQLNPIKG
ncbi:toxin C-terminal domain-containing protein, partial [Acetobacter indonesiensis]